MENRRWTGSKRGNRGQFGRNMAVREMVGDACSIGRGGMLTSFSVDAAAASVWRHASARTTAQPGNRSNPETSP